MRARKPTIGALVCLAGLLLGSGGCRHAGIVGLPDPDPIHQGRELTRKGKAPDAYAHFQRLLKDRPDDLAVHRGLVEAAYYAGRLADVRDFYQALLGRPAKEGLGHYGLALVAVAEGPGHMEEALAALARAEEKWPKEADVPYRVGLVYLMNGEYEKARQALARALELDPQRPGPHVAMGNVLLKAGQLEQAIEMLRPILHQAPSAEEVAKARALTSKIYDPLRGLDPELSQDVSKVLDLLAQDEIQPALTAVDALVARNPDLSIAHTFKGIAHSRMGDGGEAIVSLEHALELQPRNPTALVALGDIFLKTEKWQRARECFEGAVTLDPFDSEAHARLAELADTRQDYDRAERAYAMLALLDPDLAEPRLKRAQALVHGNRRAEAVVVLTELVARQPEHLEGLIRLGMLHAEMIALDPASRDQHQEGSLAAFRRARELAPNNALIREWLAKLEG